ncbi:hypothetical protein OU619_24560, partial [Escherichia coli]|nr:hypothetical protein [Escherichia coli]
MLKTNFWASVVSFLCFWPWNEQWKSTKSSWLTFSVRVSGNDSNLLIVFYVQIMPDDFVMQLHR